MKKILIISTCIVSLYISFCIGFALGINTNKIQPDIITNKDIVITPNPLIGQNITKVFDKYEKEIVSTDNYIEGPYMIYRFTLKDKSVLKFKCEYKEGSYKIKSLD